MTIRELEFRKNNGYRIAAKAYIPEDGCGKYPTVIFSHGFGGCFKHHEGNGPRFAEAGIAIIYFDFCGGGLESSSDGSMLEMTVLTEVEDLETVINQARKLDFVDIDRFVLMGESQGGFVSALVAAKNVCKLAALTLMYPALVIPDDSKRRFEAGENNAMGTELSPNYNSDAKDIDVYEEIPKFTGPVQIVHGDADPIVPISYSERAEATYTDCKLLTIPGAGHGFGPEDNDTAMNCLIGFIKKVVEG